MEVVIAQRQIGGQHVADGPPRAVFQDELSRRRPGYGRAGTDHADRLAPRRDAIGLGAAHGIQDRRRSIGGNLLPAVIGSGVEGGVQGVMIRHARQVPGVAGTIVFIRLYREGKRSKYGVRRLTAAFRNGRFCATQFSSRVEKRRQAIALQKSGSDHARMVPVPNSKSCVTILLLP